MKKIICILLINLTSFICYSQTCFPKIAAVEFKNYVILEQRINSTRRTANEYHAMTNLAQPVQFIRNNTNFKPRPIIQYFFSVPDSIVRRIYLIIDSTNYLPLTYQARMAYKEKDIRLNDFEEQYKTIIGELTASFGNPQETTPLNKQDGIWIRKDSWENDSIKIQAYMFFGGSKVAGNSRIRAEINYKYSKPSKTIHNDVQLSENEEINKQQDSTSKLFLSYVFNGDYKSSWMLIDDKLKSKLSYENYVKNISPMTNLKNENGTAVELFMNGSRVDQTGSKHPFYSYIFKSDKSTPPETKIDVVFENADSEKIIGVNPMSMKRTEIRKMK